MAHGANPAAACICKYNFIEAQPYSVVHVPSLAAFTMTELNSCDRDHLAHKV